MFSLNSGISATKYLFTVKWPTTQPPGCYHSASKTHVEDRIFKSSLIHASVIIRFPEFIKSSAPFRKKTHWWEKTSVGNNKSLAVRGYTPPTCGMESNPGCSRGQDTCPLRSRTLLQIELGISRHMVGTNSIIMVTWHINHMPKGMCMFPLLSNTINRYKETRNMLISYCADIFT